MDLLLRFFDSYAPLFYIVLALVAIITLRRLFQVWQESRSAVFGLEREIARRRIAQALTALAIVALLVVAELIIETVLAPNLPASSLLPTSTVDPLTTPTNTILPFLATDTVQPDATLIPVVSGCIPGQIAITFPEAGGEIRGQIVLTGSASVPNFGFYKYEVAAIGADLWTTISAGRQIIQDGDLGRWDTSQLTPGDYLLRLVVTDNQGNAFPPCVVPVRVLAP
ncbi:MAG: hypothetical protein JXB85_07230 [Anaerolineales bacterium]|nr:hypothetical protein [Anaerolineales bacterium]